jgi:KaiC/GvpD/RAD55 family RecA-like ATPase
MHEETRGESRRAAVQVPTGIPGLDRLLNGGVRQGGLHVVVGGPGAGKSVLAHQIGANLIRAEGEGVGLPIRRGVEEGVIDAAEDLTHAVIPRKRELFVLSSLANLLRQRGVTTVFMHDLRRIVGVSFDMPMAELSAVLDNALHLRYVEQKGEMRRLIAILKVRSRAHDRALRELHITDKGLSVGKAFTGSEMVLTGLGIPR